MELKNIIWMMFYVSLLIIRGTLAKENSDHDPHSLDEFLHDYAQKVVKSPQTGRFYDIPLHSNYSSIDISYIRIRTASIWTLGISSSFIHIPSKTRILPFVERLDIVFQDLGNLSSYYYSVPNHRFVTPILGFTIYNADKNSSANHNSEPDLSLEGNNTILVRFYDISPVNATMRCVRIRPNGHIVFGNVSVPNVCHVHGQGHFGIVVLNSKAPSSKKEVPKWWLIELGVGIGGIILFGLVATLACHFARKKKFKSMERRSEKSEALDTFWVGTSKMPSAGGIRTQPVLENDFFP